MKTGKRPLALQQRRVRFIGDPTTSALIPERSGFAPKPPIACILTTMIGFDGAMRNCRSEAEL